MRREGRKLSELASVMTRYPQVMINVRVSADGKLLFYTDPEVKRAIDEAKRELGKEGRIVARISGTEPLIRVMVEGMDDGRIREVAERVAGVVRARLGAWSPKKAPVPRANPAAVMGRRGGRGWFASAGGSPPLTTRGGRAKRAADEVREASKGSADVPPAGPARRQAAYKYAGDRKTKGPLKA